MRISLRIALALLLAAAALAAPVGVSAEPPSARHEAGPGWLDALRSLLAPIRGLWAGSDEGPMVDPNGIAAPPPGSRSAGSDEGPMMDPNGIAAPPPPTAGTTNNGEGDHGPMIDPSG